MKTIQILLIALLLASSATAQDSTKTLAPAKEYKVITIIESIVPMGLGRSRMVENTTEVNTAESTTGRTDGKTSGQGSVKRSDLKVDEFNETKLLNFYSGVGINFQNIASNDAMITARMNELSVDGWTLSFFATGVESKAGKDDSEGIYITRMVFTR
jgi:hypothetical protein